MSLAVELAQKEQKARALPARFACLTWLCEVERRWLQA